MTNHNDVKKKLIIAQSANDVSKLKEFDSEEVDILALTQDVMFVLDKHNLSYVVFEDFYSEESYIENISNFHNNVDTFFLKLDKSCEAGLVFPYAYSGNEHYLLTWLDDLFYLEKFIEAIKSDYNQIFLLAEKLPQKISKDLLSINKLNSKNVNGSISLKSEKSIERKIQIIFNNANIIFIKDTISTSQKIPTVFKINFFYNRFRKFIKNELRLKTIKVNQNSDAKKTNVYLVQDGYEVLHLKKYLPNYNYLNPVTQIRSEVLLLESQTTRLPNINKLIEKFVKGNFKNLGNYIELILFSYHFEVVGRIESFQHKLEYELQKDKPKLMLFSLGIRDVFDMIIALMANKYNIPVVFFQHGGSASALAFNPYQKSIEYNPKILKSLIIQSKKDLQNHQNPKTKVLSMGSISKFEIVNIEFHSKRSKKILFCLGPDVNLFFRFFLNYYSNAKKYNNLNDVLSVLDNNSLLVDIKLHPTGEHESNFLLKKIINKYQYNSTNIIYGNFAELIVKNYQIIIIDYLGTEVLNHILALDICLVIYNPNFDELRINEEIKNDLQNRCYIVKNKTELESIMIKHNNGQLQTKYNEYFVDKYVFPSDEDNPGIKISDYIQSVI
jgi:hypothetical protein